MSLPLRVRIAIFVGLALLVGGAVAIQFVYTLTPRPVSTAKAEDDEPMVELSRTAPDSDESSGDVPSADRPALVTTTGSSSPELNELSGYLIVTEGNCYGLQTDEGAFVAVFPSTMSHRADEGIEDAGRPFRLGNRITGLAAFAPGEDWSDVVPGRCLTDQVVVMDYVIDI